MEEIINNNDDEQKDNDRNEDKDFEEYEKSVICATDRRARPAR